MSASASHEANGNASESKRTKQEEEDQTTDKRVAEIRGLYPPGCICYDLPITHTIAHNVNMYRKQIESIIKYVAIAYAIAIASHLLLLIN